MLNRLTGRPLTKQEWLAVALATYATTGDCFLYGFWALCYIMLGNFVLWLPFLHVVSNTVLTAVTLARFQEHAIMVMTRQARRSPLRLLLVESPRE